MALFTIADLHLSSDGTKSMEKFGSRWADYMQRLAKNWNAVVHPDDTVIIPGDISWGLKLEDSLEDFLFFDRMKNKVFPVKRERKGVKKAVLDYRVLEEKDGYTLVSVLPKTGRTHQIRVQFASRKLPLYGDRKYSGSGEALGLFCKRLSFSHPKTNQWITFSAAPEKDVPWTLFQI